MFAGWGVSCVLEHASNSKNWSSWRESLAAGRETIGRFRKNRTILFFPGPFTVRYRFFLYPHPPRPSFHASPSVHHCMSLYHDVDPRRSAFLVQSGPTVSRRVVIHMVYCHIERATVCHLICRPANTGYVVPGFAYRRHSVLNLKCSLGPHNLKLLE